MLRRFAVAVSLALALLLPGMASAQLVPDAVRDARASVYRVEGVVPEDGIVIGGGTAWAVTPSKLITNAHVIDAIEEFDAGGKQKDILVVDADGRSFAVIEAQSFDHIDAGILTIAGATLQPLEILPRELAVDTPIWNLGYPASADTIVGYAQQAQLSSGTIQSYNDFHYTSSRFRTTRVFRHDAESSGGSSGSPMLNGCGQVVGLLFAGAVDQDGTPLAGATRVAISSFELANYMDEEARSLKFTAASGCTFGQGGGLLWWVWLIGGGLAAGSAPLAWWFWRRGAGPRPAPSAASNSGGLARRHQGPAAADLPKDTLCLSGDGPKGPFEIQAKFRKDGSLRLGSTDDPSKGNDLVLAFHGVSRSHAQFMRVGDTDTLIVTDLGSTNGTFVGSNRVGKNQQETLVSGDTLKVGKWTLKVQIK